MEPATIAAIATTVVSAVAPFVKKGADKLVEKGTEEAFAKRGEIWSKVKGLFSSDDLTTLNLFEANPDDPKTQGRFEGKVEELLKANPETAEELDALVKQLPAIQAKQNTMNITGDGNIGIQDVSGSSIKINK